MEIYGHELVLDLHNCNVDSFNRTDIDHFFSAVCVATDMQKCELHWWDDLETKELEKQTDPKTVGTSAVQFILTSNITIHALDKLQKIFINFFSCKEFDPNIVKLLAVKQFSGEIVNELYISRL